MQKDLSCASRHAAVWITTLALIGLSPTSAFAHHPTTDQIPGWAHFVLDIRWGNIGGDFGIQAPPVTYDGTITMSGEHGVVFPMNPYAWEWGEDELPIFEFQESRVEPTPRSFTFTSVIHNHFDGMRLRVAGPKDATLTIGLNDFTYSATLESLATTHEKVIESIGNDHEIVVKTLPMLNPKAQIDIFWGKIFERHAFFNPENRQSAPLSFRRDGGTAFAAMTNSQENFFGDPRSFFEQDPNAFFEGFRPQEFNPFFFEDETGFDFSGSLEVSQGALGRVHTKSFEGTDGILSKTDSLVSWESQINAVQEGRNECPMPLMGGGIPIGSSGTHGVLGPEGFGMPGEGFMPPMPPPPCMQFRFDRDGIRAQLNLAALTDVSPITLRFSSPDVNWTKTISLEGLFTHPIMEPIEVRGESGGFGVMMALHEEPDRKLLRAEGYAEVFFIEDGIRRHIPNPEVFKENGFAWDEIENVDPEEFDTIPEDIFDPVSFPDGELVQPEGDPTVYLFDDGERRPIPNPEVLRGIGMDFDDVRRVPPEALSRFPQGPSVPPPGMGRPPDGIPFRIGEGPGVFVLDDGRRRPISSPEIFEANRFDWGRVAEFGPDHPFAQAPEASPFPPPDGSLIQTPGNPTVYVYDEEQGRAMPVDDAEDFQDAGFRWENVRSMEQGAFSQIPIAGGFVAGGQDVSFAQPIDLSFTLPAPPSPFTQ